jgi:hypothetical protein
MTARNGRFSRANLDRTLDWKPESELSILTIDDEVSAHALMSGGNARVIPADESWPVKDVKSILKDG